MRTLVILMLLALCVGCRAQVDTSFKQFSHKSFSGRCFHVGETSYPMQKTVSFSMVNHSLVMDAGTRVSVWPMRFFNELKDDDGTIDSYASRDNMTIRLVYIKGDLVDIVFTKGLYSCHFYISYPKTV